MSTATTENDRTVPYTSRSDNIANLLRDLDPLVKLMENTLKDKDRNLSEEDEGRFLITYFRMLFSFMQKLSSPSPFILL